MNIQRCGENLKHPERSSPKFRRAAPEARSACRRCAVWVGSAPEALRNIRILRWRKRRFFQTFNLKCVNVVITFLTSWPSRFSLVMV